MWKHILVIAFLTLRIYEIALDLEFHEEWGMKAVLWMQSHHSPALDVFMKLCSGLGFETFFLLVPILCWWGTHRLYRISQQLMLLLMEAFFVQSFAKMMFARPRPYRASEAVLQGKEIPIAAPGGEEYSFPSGHAMGATVAWLFVALAFSEGRHGHPTAKRPLYIAGACCLIVLTCFARVYFGFHYPHDMVAGALLGLLFLKIFLKHLHRHPDEASHSNIIAHYIILVAMIIVNFILRDRVGHTKQAGLHYTPPIMLGILVGMLFTSKPTSEASADSVAGRRWRRRLVRISIGLVGVFLCVAANRKLYYAVYPTLAMNLLAETARYATATGGILWIMLLAPKLFKWLSLHEAEKTMPQAENKKHEASEAIHVGVGE